MLKCCTISQILLILIYTLSVSNNITHYQALFGIMFTLGESTTLQFMAEQY